MRLKVRGFQNLFLWDLLTVSIFSRTRTEMIYIFIEGLYEIYYKMHRDLLTVSIFSGTRTEMIYIFYRRIV